MQNWPGTALLSVARGRTSMGLKGRSISPSMVNNLPLRLQILLYRVTGLVITIGK